MRTIVPSLFSLLLIVGCSSATPSNRCDENALLDPDCGHTGLPTGSHGSTSGDGGDNAGGAGNGGAGGNCEPSVTCESVNAECGTIADNGCGEETVCPDNCSGVNHCGGAGEQFKCGCTPREFCSENECGIVSDGCGGEIDCGVKACQGSYRIAECGADDMNDSGEGTQPGAANTCGDICVELDSNTTMCSGYSMFPRMWVCYEPQVEFFTGCWNTIADGEGMESAVWCCPPFD
jgi:hypothetical protein